MDTIDNAQLDIALRETFGFKRFCISVNHPSFANHPFNRVVTLQAQDFVKFASANGIQQINYVRGQTTDMQMSFDEYSFAFQDAIFITRDKQASQLIQDSGLQINQ